jgi:hypothetical protein
MQARALSHRNRGRIRGRLEKNSTAEPVAEQKRKEKAKQRQAFFRYRERTCKKQYRNNRGKVEKGQKSANQKRETEEIHKWQQNNSDKCVEAKVVTNGTCQNRNGKHGSLTTVTARVQQL